MLLLLGLRTVRSDKGIVREGFRRLDLSEELMGIVSQAGLELLRQVDELMHMRRRGGPRTVKSGKLLLGPTGAGCLQPFPCIDCALCLVAVPLSLLRFSVTQEPL